MLLPAFFAGGWVVLSSTADGVTTTCTNIRYCTPRKSDLLVDSDRHGASQVARSRVERKMKKIRVDDGKHIVHVALDVETIETPGSTKRPL